jgi:hypothetical protein
MDARITSGHDECLLSVPSRQAASRIECSGLCRQIARSRETGDRTRHPEFELARWAAANMSPEARAAATVFTSAEH